MLALGRLLGHWMIVGVRVNMILSKVEVSSAIQLSAKYLIEAVPSQRNSVRH
jgi:hypothetical protein